MTQQLQTSTPSPGMTVVKTAAIVGNTDGITEAGDLVYYTIVVTNTGNVTLFDVEITDVLTDQTGNGLTLTQDAAIDGVLRDIAPGVSETYNVTYLIEQAAADTGSIINVASASATILDGSTVTPVYSDPAIVTMTANPSIEITKTSSENDGGDGTMDVGDTIDYTLTITNTGNVTLDTISLTDTLTDGSGIETDLSSAITLVSLNGTPQALLDDLEVGDVAIYTVSYTVDQAAMNSGMVSNIATVTASSPNDVDDVTDTTDTAVENELDQLPSMTLTKSAALNDGGDGSLDLGDTITYTLTLTNTGNVSLSSVSLTDTITDLSGAALSLQSGPTYITGGTSFASTSIMAVDDVIVYEAVFEINQQAINAGGVSNTAEASVTTPSQDSLTATSNTVNTPISSIASLEVNKTATINDNGDGVNGLSDLIEYTITVENTGDIALENLTITDVITDNIGNSLSLVSGPFFAGSTANSAEGKLKVGEVASYKAYYIITQQAVDAGGVVNNVNATANVPGSTSIVSDDLDTPTTTTITEDPEIEVIKTAIISDNGDGVTGLGDTIDYTIRISNTGNVTLNSLTLIDTITDATGVALASSPLVTSFVSSDQNSTAGNLAVGETATYTTSYVIDQNAVDSGGVLNSVTADASSPAGTSISDMSDDGDPSTDTNADVDNDPTNDPT